MTLDVRTKISLIIFGNYLLLKRVPPHYEWVAILGLVGLFLLAKQTRKGLRYLGVFTSFYLIDVYVLDALSGNLASFLSVFAVGMRLMLPCIMAGSLLLSTTSSSQLVNGLRVLRLPEKLVLTLAVMFRFLPVLAQDFRAIRQSLALRGLPLQVGKVLRRPATYFRYILIPLVMSASRSAQDLTIATMTKAVGSYRVPSLYVVPRMGRADYLVYTCVLLFLLGIHYF